MYIPTTMVNQTDAVRDVGRVVYHKQATKNQIPPHQTEHRAPFHDPGNPERREEEETKGYATRDVEMNVLDLRVGRSNIGDAVERYSCPNLRATTKKRAIALNIVGLTPVNTAIPAALDITSYSMTCSFESHSTGPIPSRIVIPIPRTTCANTECACMDAITNDNWAVITVHGGGKINLLAAFSVAEDRYTGKAEPFFEMATVIVDSSEDTTSTTEGLLLLDIERTIIPISCRLTLK